MSKCPYFDECVELTRSYRGEAEIDKNGNYTGLGHALGAWKKCYDFEEFSDFKEWIKETYGIENPNELICYNGEDFSQIKARGW